MLDWLPKTAEGVPMLGSIINGAESIYHLGAMGIDYAFDDQEGMKEHAGKAGWHAIKSIPYLGTGLSAIEFFHDYYGPTGPNQCDAPYTGEDGVEYCENPGGDPYPVYPEERTLAEKFTEWVIPYEAENTRQIPDP